MHTHVPSVKNALAPQMRVVPYWVAGLQQAAQAASLAQTWSLGVQSGLQANVAFIFGITQSLAVLPALHYPGLRWGGTQWMLSTDAGAYQLR